MSIHRQLRPPSQRARCSAPLRAVFGAILVGSLLLSSLCGCASSPPPRREANSPSPTRIERPQRQEPALAASPAVALIGDEAIAWNELRPRVVESAGAMALDELVLERQLALACRRAGIAIQPDDVNAERERMLAALIETGAAADENDAARALRAIRSRRGLGTVRFESMLRRNAMLRALVRSEVQITDAALEQARELRYGPRYRVRVIVCDTPRDIAAAWDRVKEGESFALVAGEVSTDESAERGGLIGPISPADTAYPSALRQVMASMPIGTVSEPIVLDEGYAIVLVERRIESPRPPEDPLAARAQLERDVRMTQERILMDQLARRMMAEARVTVLDPTLREARENAAR